jgi:hypothetical protein
MNRQQRLLGALRLEVFRSASLPIWSALCVVLGAAVIARVHFEIPWLHTMGDPASVAGWPFYLGFVSNVGALLWTAAASIFLFSFCVHRSSGGDTEWGRFLLCSGLFVGLLGLDDLFMLHEQVFPNYLSISQSLVVASYAGLAALYVARFAAVIAQTAYPVFVAAIAMLAASATLDQIHDHFSIAFGVAGFFEDAAKLLGIGTWLSYAIHTSAALLRREHSVPTHPAGEVWLKEFDLADGVRRAFGHFFRRDRSSISSN